MATFQNTKGQFSQEHFEVFEIDLPVITGTCTVGGVGGYGTPLTCDQSWTNEYKTYKFTNINAPTLSGSLIHRSMVSVKENTTEIKPSKGLSSRGTLTITLNDFKGDPNPDATGVGDTVKSSGTFFGKLASRQILDNKAARIKLYRVESDGTIDLINGAETHYYIIDTLKRGSNNQWVITCKDVLSLANIDDKSFPSAAGGKLRADIK